jgi:TM2 domain-containing membrane protein YozV
MSSKDSATGGSDDVDATVENDGASIDSDGSSPETQTGNEERAQPGPREQFCSSCGSVIKEAAEICPECGVRQQSSASGSGSTASNLGGNNVPDSKRNPLIAGFLSVILPGLGQAYNLQYTKAAVMFIAFIAGWASSAFLIGFILGPIIHIYSAYDGRKEAQRINREHF